MKYFSKAFISAENDFNFNLSYETIGYQKDDPFCKDLEKEISRLGFTNDSVLHEYNKSEVDSVCDKITNLIYKRFGMNIIVKNVDGEYPYTYPVITNMTSSVNKHIFPLLDDIVNYKNNGDDEIYSKTIEAIKKSITDTRLENLSVNLDKAVVYNLPKDYTGYIIIDFKLLAGRNLKTSEVTASILHEIGHSFISIENSYRCVNNSFILIDSVKEGLNKDSTPYTILSDVYKKIYGEKPNKGTDPRTIVLNLVESNCRLATAGDPIYDDTDRNNERLSDLFASRFGYGKDLVTGLDKMEKGNDTQGIMYKSLLNYKLVSVIGGPIFFGASVLLTLAGALTVSPLLVVAAGLNITCFFTGLMIDERSFVTTYDFAYDRFNKIKLDLIRVVRTMQELDDNYIKRIIADIHAVEDILNRTAKTPDNLSDRIFRLFSRSKTMVFNMEKSERLIEELLENDLWVSSKKLQQFI